MSAQLRARHLDGCGALGPHEVAVDRAAPPSRPRRMCEAHACQTRRVQVRFLPTGSSASVVALSTLHVLQPASFLLYSREN
jgi:hypothetical protein